MSDVTNPAAPLTAENMPRLLAVALAAYGEMSDGRNAFAEWAEQMIRSYLAAARAASTPAGLRELLITAVEAVLGRGEVSTVDGSMGTDRAGALIYDAMLPYLAAASPETGEAPGLDEEHCCNDPSHMSAEYLAALSPEGGAE